MVRKGGNTATSSKRCQAAANCVEADKEGLSISHKVQALESAKHG
jgi:hypothetical protein